jgi:tRNA (guanine-N7-)-methyltransferase
MQIDKKSTEDDFQTIQEEALRADEAAADENMQQRRIRSFVLRQGRLTKGQEKALEKMLPKYGIGYDPDLKLDLHAQFGRSESPKILEIGFGMGETTARIAAAMPDKDFLGIEVHTPGVGSLLKQMDEQNLHNIRIIQHDAVEVLQHMLVPECLDGVHIYFPDPWHKKRHHKRRLIQKEFVELLCSRMKAGAYIHVATDWQEYAEWVLDVLRNTASIINTVKDFAERPSHRPLTKFEQRGLNLGHGVWDMVFKKSA